MGIREPLRGGTAGTGPDFDPEAVRAAMRELEFTGLARATPAEQAYFAFYGIDFERSQPGLVHHFGRLHAAGFEIACHYFVPPRACGTCLLLHGYFDHAGVFGHLIAHCLSRGYAVLIWDLPGHGLSSGPRASIHSFEDYVDVLGAVLERYGPALPRPLHAIGQSTGGAVLMGWAFRHRAEGAQCPLDRMVLLAPLVRPAEWRRAAVLHTLLRPFREAVSRRFAPSSADAEFLEFLQRDPLQSRTLPVQWVSAMRNWVQDFLAAPPSDYAPLVIQGDADETVDWQWNLERIREKFPRAELRVLTGAQHQLVNERAATRAQVFEAIGLDPCPGET